MNQEHGYSRRAFVGHALTSSAGLALTAGMPQSWLRSLASETKNSERVLVVIQLSGGNDGLNTIVPYADDEYRKSRPKLSIAASDVLKIDGTLGFHPRMRAASELLNAGKLSIVQGVGYPVPNRSHFESMDIWHTCRAKDSRPETGWIGGMIDAGMLATGTDSPAIHLGSEQQPRALSARKHALPSVASIDQFRLRISERSYYRDMISPEDSSEAAPSSELLDFLQTNTTAALSATERLSNVLGTPDQSQDFPKSALAEKLRIVARLITAGLQTRVYYVTLDGFDTHAQQPAAHASLLENWSEALSAFTNFLEARGQAERTIVLTFSEFGRRVAENASNGTDHGAAAPVFLSGTAVLAPVVGVTPSLTDLNDGDLKYHTDFRSIYATIIEKWFGIPSAGILGAQYPVINLIQPKYVV